MPTPSRRFAGLRETGTLCPHCQIELRTGDDTAVCGQCGSSQHWDCWQTTDGCGSYECSNGRRPGSRNGGVLQVSFDDLEQARPLPVSRPTFAVGPIPISLRLDDERDDPTPKTWNKLAIAALVLSILGVPLFGAPGLIGIVLGAVALAMHTRRQKGLGVAITGVLLGIADCIGWVIVLAFYFAADAPGLAVRPDGFEPDPAALRQLPPHISRAMAANVLVHSSADWGRLRGEGLGSGVILRIKEATALIVTNRHVVDPTFAENSNPEIPALDKMSKLEVKMLGQALSPATVVWVAPGGIDLALIRVAVTAVDPQAAEWEEAPTLTIGDDVVAVGNPHGLGWTLTKGTLSQMRLNDFGGHETKIIQTSAAINPGNSGGGLYDKAGKLIGINTWTKDKRMAEGLSFAITFTTLLDLAPAEHQLKAK
ncbi:MAG: trypsin-like peptidase domain-containing protein [Planctomycetaceae bacterium]